MRVLERHFLRLIFFPFTQIHKIPLYTASYQLLDFPLDNSSFSYKIFLDVVCCLLLSSMGRILPG